MATIFSAHLHHHGWLGKVEDYVSAHRVHALLAALAGIAIGGSFGLIIFGTLFETGDLRTIVMLFPHAFLMTFVMIGWFIALFSLRHEDP